MPTDNGPAAPPPFGAADAIVERRRLRRALTRWRVAAIAVAALAVAGAAVSATGLARRDQIARIAVSGVIAEDRDRLELLSDMADDPTVKAVIVAIDSPGGTTAGGEALYDGLRRLAAKKPVVATIGTLGASAGYMVAIAADHVVARRTSITGSIGVLFQYGDAARLLETLGVNVDAVKSSPLKAAPMPWAPASPEARAMLQSVVDDTYVWFTGLVAERRQLSPEAARAAANGRIMTGHQALELKLVDALGGEEEAIGWLEKSRGIAPHLPVRSWEVRKPSTLTRLFSAAGEGAGTAMAEALGARLGLSGSPTAQMPAGAAGGRVDGLPSVWQVDPRGTEDGGQGASVR
ncbi:signal peptide peptidase SppA [Pseudoxanthobacter sp.]|uniref:signal peptide peptidase SppA n=1 Tax=Pseudoxanthobacter sp. TaxID=1925742 RepID=UPI002FE1B8A5